MIYAVLGWGGKADLTPIDTRPRQCVCFLLYIHLASRCRPSLIDVPSVVLRPGWFGLLPLDALQIPPWRCRIWSVWDVLCDDHGFPPCWSESTASCSVFHAAQCGSKRQKSLNCMMHTGYSPGREIVSFGDLFVPAACSVSEIHALIFQAAERFSISCHCVF